ncbi:LacI family DNA-binding transcriptional regulator [Flavivirga spongiicola]|uniref:LacI family DNA-binding transcriptional regulator n=1 Tax=Flavivirga spongiicola TaxID=421621 RepID=A0ABU7XZG7_9FLAO|nr:LacI family DNA-binding transcriptional regulator [Flavivirga sp. MEBiC05379]MDO5980239.1 LacI family DNA-binding transcriptional regulator [Flavivirga sp. MEBiC05379]
MKKYTIKDIADLAGVSKGTVDRVIHKRGKVSKKALESVTKLLEEINYQPNLIARNLKNNKVYRICILIPDPEVDDYWSPCIHGINSVINELNAFGIHIETVLFNSKSTKSFLNANENVQKLSPDAVLMVPFFYKETLIALEDYHKLGIIVSTINNRIESEVVKGFVGQDLHQSGRVAAKLMQSTTQKKGDIVIIHIDEKYKNAIHMQEKERGFREYYKQFNHFENTIITLKLKRTDFEISLINFLNEHENLAGLCVTTSKGYQVADVLSKINAAKVSLIGYDLVNENVTHLKNGVIDFLIHQNPKQQAYLGLKSLAEHLLFEKELPNEILLPIDIINSENVKPFMRD